MKEEQMEYIAELIFQKMLKKQEEWDKENGYIATTARESILSEIVALNLIKSDYLDTEQYEKVNEIQQKINRLKESLK